MKHDSQPIYQAKIWVEFDTEEDRKKFVEQLRAELPGQVASMNYSTTATCCRLCGIDRKFQTLGSGITPAWDAVDECRGAHVMSCQRRQKANAAWITREPRSAGRREEEQEEA